MLTALLLSVAAAAAEDTPLARPLPGPLSLADVLDSADRTFPSLVGARADVEAAEGDALSAVGGFDPAWRTRAFHVPVGGYPQTRVDSIIEVNTPLWGASVFAGYRLGFGQIEDYYAERTTWTLGEVRAGLVVPLIRNGPIDRRRASLQRAELGRQVAGLSVEQQRIEIGRLAAVRYWEWVATGQRREVVRGLLSLATDRDTQLAARAAAGDVAEFDRQDNLRAVAQRQAAVLQAQRGVEQAGFELSLFLRDENGEPVMPPDTRMPTAMPEPLPRLGDSISVDDALARRPDVQRLLQQRKQQEIELTFQQNQLLPALDIGVTVTQDLGASPSPKFDPLGQTAVELSAVLEVPLLYRAPLGRIQAARAALAKLDAQLRLARDRVAVEVRDALSAYTAATGRLEATRTEVEVSVKLERGERARFELGDSTLFLVNLREQTTAEARLREVDALLDAQRAAAALRAALALAPGDKLP